MEFYGLSYTVYQEKQTNELKARVWLDAPDMGYTHTHCIRELQKDGHTPVSNGVLLYDKTTDCWLPIFESPLSEERSESERRCQIDTACQKARRQTHSRPFIKERLAQLWENKMISEQKICIAKNMPTEAIRIHMKNMRSNCYY